MKKVLLGNAAIALGAIEAGVEVVCGYPGTPSTEVLQSVAANNKDKKIYVEWSTNEKAALEVAAGAAYAGSRVMVTMKQVGLNVASDPLMSLAYIGVKGGMVVLVADDPGPISSQTEQDTRLFGEYSSLVVLDPASPEEAFEMAKYAFELSERIGKPVILRPTTKVCHASATIEVGEAPEPKAAEGFVKDPRWVIFPPLSYRRHTEMHSLLHSLSVEFADSGFNTLKKGGKLGIAAGGVTSAILADVLADLGVDCTMLKVGIPHPAPETLYAELAEYCDKVLVLEELSPIIENGIFRVMGEQGISCKLQGRRDNTVKPAGELKYDDIMALVCAFCGIATPERGTAKPMELPMRAPVLCAGCPHRASFFAVKRAMKNRKAVFCGDIGCYTLGNAKPLEMTDTCLCMGAGITIAQGIKRAEPDTTAFAFIGDSTFFASGMTGLANAAYNNSDIVVCVLDNSTTAMTGHQPHPGIGQTMMDTKSPKIDIANVARALNVGFVREVDPLNLEESEQAVREAADHHGVSLIIFRSPCVAIVKPDAPLKIDGCVGCMKCVRELGCPAIFVKDKKAGIDPTLCTGCGLCAQVCPTHCIK